MTEQRQKSSAINAIHIICSYVNDTVNSERLLTYLSLWGDPFGPLVFDRCVKRQGRKAGGWLNKPHGHCLSGVRQREEKVQHMEVIVVELGFHAGQLLDRDPLSRCRVIRGLHFRQAA